MQTAVEHPTLARVSFSFVERIGMGGPTMNKDVEDRREGQKTNADIPEDVIHLPERDPSSIAHIASPRLVHPEQAKDFIKEVIEDTTDDGA